MDKTALFKASVMSVKLQRKGELDSKRILPKSSAQRDEFSKQAKEVCQNITSLRNLLLENRSAYMRIGQHLKNAAQMTDEQRDLIDRESEKFVTFYTQYLGQMRSEWKRTKRKPQQRDHIEAVLELLSEYLRSVQQIYLEQKKYRVQHELETYRLLKLAADRKKIPVRPAGMQRSRQGSTGSSYSSKGSQTFNSSEDSDASSEMDLSDGWQLENVDSSARNLKTHKTKEANGLSATPQKRPATTTAESKAQVALNEDIQKTQQLLDEAEAAKELSPEDVQMFEEENIQLYHELQGLSEEVEAIEKNVVDIAQLQDIFSEKVSMQQHNIERIANAVVGATENVKDANEQIKQAIQRNAGLRVWSLFFLLVMSFALLFLDWYYD